MISDFEPLASESNGPVSKPGCAQLKVELVSGQSTATVSYASNPLKLLTPRSRGQSVWAYLSSFGGGFVAGDETRFEIQVGAGACCFVGTQAATKIYRNPAGLPCGQRTLATVESGGLLIYAPDPVQAFAGSTYSQIQEWRLAQGAGLVLQDWFCSGRVARGECWAFDRYQSRNEVFVGGERVLVDSILLDSKSGNPALSERMGQYHCFAFLLLMGAPLNAVKDRLLDEASVWSLDREPTVLASVSPVRDGALLRVAGVETELVRARLRQALEPIRLFLGDDPWERRW